MAGSCHTVAAMDFASELARYAARYPCLPSRIGAVFGRSSHYPPDENESKLDRLAGTPLASQDVSGEMTSNLASQPPTSASAESAVSGALLALPNYFKPAVGKGDLVAVVIDAKTERRQCPMQRLRSLR